MKISVAVMVAALTGIASSATAQMFGLPIVYSGKPVEASAVTVSAGATIGTSDSYGNVYGARGAFGVANDFSILLDGGAFAPKVDDTKISPAMAAWLQYDPTMLELPWDVYTGVRVGFSSMQQRYEADITPDNLSSACVLGLANMPLGTPGIFSLYGGAGVMIPTGELDYEPIVAAGALCDVARDVVSIYAEADYVDHVYFSAGISCSF